MKLTQEMKHALRVIGQGGSVVHLTTASREGKPNIVAERFVTFYQDEFILIADMFAQKTKVNLNENPHAVVSIAHPTNDRSWIFSGPATVLSHAADPDMLWNGIRAGDALDEWGDWGDWAAKEPPDEVPPDIAPPRLAQRGLIVIKVDKIRRFDLD